MPFGIYIKAMGLISIVWLESLPWDPLHATLSMVQGMGEPLNNYKQVRDAIKLMTEPTLFALSKRHVTLSTVGVVPRLLQIGHDLPVGACC